MKKNTIIKSILVIIIFIFSFFSFNGVKEVNALATTLNAGRVIDISSANGNLNDTNIKIEFTTSVNLDGTNNALLVGLASSDDTVLTDARFVATSTNAGVLDEDDVAIMFENAPSAIGTKTSVGLNYHYEIQTQDFTVVNGTKNVAKLVIIGQKGTIISAEVTYSKIYDVAYEEAVENIDASMKLGFSFDKEDTTYTNVKCVLGVGIDKSIANNIVDVSYKYGIEVSTSTKTSYYDSETGNLIDGAVYYKLINLGDVINNPSRATDVFTIRPYIEVNETKYYST